MGKLREIINNLIDRTDIFFDKNTEPLPPSTQEQIQPAIFEMTPGKKLSKQEIIEENQNLIQSLDPKLMFLIKVVYEVNKQDVLKTIAQDYKSMQEWLAHIAYRTKIDNFNSLLSGRNLNLLDPNLLVPKKHRKEFTGKTIKCLTDLPLQKSLLN